MITPRKHVEMVLRGEQPDRTPFTIYESKLPPCAVERDLRNRGLCIVKRDVPVIKVTTPHVNVTSSTCTENGTTLVRTDYRTPVGDLHTIHQPAGFTSWVHKRLWSRPEDYKPLLFFIKDSVVEPCYEVFARAERNFGEDAIFRGGMGLEPMQALISGYMGTEEFCIEWMERRDEVLNLYHAIIEERRKMYPLLAGSPAGHFNYGGNVVPEIVGLERYDKYYVQHYKEAAEILHRHGKLIGSHYDANCRLFKERIAGLPLDYIEAFTPSPDTDMSVKEALAAWPDKILWINYPSSVHLKPEAEVARTAVEIMEEARPGNRFIMGITEDVPEDRWQGNCLAIMGAIEKFR